MTSQPSYATLKALLLDRRNEEALAVAKQGQGGSWPLLEYEISTLLELATVRSRITDDSSGQWELSAKRAPCLLIEDLTRAASLVFFVSIASRLVVGRRTISRRWLASSTRELMVFCPRIESEHLLGLLHSFKIYERQVHIRVHLFSSAECRSCFRRMGEDTHAELYYPFCDTDVVMFSDWGSRLIDGAPERFENVREADLRSLVVQLVHTEVEQRNSKHSDSSASLVVFDPACSNGLILSQLKAAIPSLITWGQDLCPDMVEAAKTLQAADRLWVGDAKNCQLVADGDVDICVVRFLTMHVVPLQDVHVVLRTLHRCLKRDGMLICYGAFTPNLVNNATLGDCGFKCVRNLHRLVADGSDHCLLHCYVAIRE